MEAIKEWLSSPAGKFQISQDLGKAVPTFLLLFAWGAIECGETLEHALLGQHVAGKVTDVEVHGHERNPKQATMAMKHANYVMVEFEYLRDGIAHIERNEYPIGSEFSVGDVIEVSYLAGRDLRGARIVGAPQPRATYFFLGVMALSAAGIALLVIDSLREPSYVRNSRYRAWQRRSK